jgi:hypothetical protein
MDGELSHTTGLPMLTVRNPRHVQATLDAICVGAVTTPAIRLRCLLIIPLQYLNSAILTLMNIAEIADIVVGAVTVASYKMVNLRTYWWVLTGGARSEMSEVGNVHDGPTERDSQLSPV